MFMPEIKGISKEQNYYASVSTIAGILFVDLNCRISAFETVKLDGSIEKF